MASQLPPATPKTVLRGHQAQVHATAFVRGNQRLASGDAEGYVVLWDLTIMRPTAVWRAHMNAILGIASWGPDKIITHGRDHKLVVWKITEDDETRLSTTLPLDASADSRPHPWIVHILEVNTMNFCSFGACAADSRAPDDELIIAVPNTLASESVDIWKFPHQERLHTVHATEKGEKSGMNGLATVFQQDSDGSWDLVYRAQTHSQPVLSLDISPDKEYFITSSADALLVKHPIPKPPASAAVLTDVAAAERDQSSKSSSRIGVSLLSAALAGEPKPARKPQKLVPEVQTQALKIVNTKHSGQQSLRIRSDGKIFATAGWDSKIRVYSAQSMKELAVLKWHQVGCYTVSFADLNVSVEEVSADRNSDSHNAAVAPRLAEMTVKERRIREAKEAHWLAAGSKDGKISLWDIY